MRKAGVDINILHRDRKRDIDSLTDQTAPPNSANMSLKLQILQLSIDIYIITSTTVQWMVVRHGNIKPLATAIAAAEERKVCRKTEYSWICLPPSVLPHLQYVCPELPTTKIEGREIQK